MSIVFKDVSKTYMHKGKEINALRPTSLTINEGEIFGLIGFSGAGKSTLLRLINLLEAPTTGTIHVGDDEVTSLNQKDLRVKRQKIGIIFQQFNLVMAPEMSAGMMAEAVIVGVLTIVVVAAVGCMVFGRKEIK